MKLWVMLLERGKQIGEITERQLGVQSTGNVQFSCAFLHSFAGDPQAIVDVMRVGIGLTRRAIEPAKLAIDVTNVCRIEVAIYIEVSSATVLAATNAVSEFTKPRQVVSGKQSDAVCERETLACCNFLCDRNQVLVVRKVHERVLRRTAPPNVMNKITLTNAFVVKNAAFSLLRSSARIRRC